jgi:hypothetical protein
MDLYLHDAFISYSRKDKPFAVLLERTLRRTLIPLSQVNQYLGLAGQIRNGDGFDFFGRS